MGFLDLKNELLLKAYDPNQVQVEVLDYLEKLANGIDIPDPTNPFMFILENSALTGSILLEQMRNNFRKLYPSLAKSLSLIHI